MARRLIKEGYCVYEIEYGVSLYGALTGIKDIRDSAKELSVVVDKMLLETKAPKVDILAHNEGTLR
ncbi:hypothetical protein BG000_004834 [Podila horticola]|nr:hypothetical protein BG000_004834 [Podila horticola]